MTTQLRLICQFQNVLDNPRNSIEVQDRSALTLNFESPRCRIETESPPTKSGKICPVASMRKRQREDHQNASDAGIGTDQAFYVVFLNRAEIAYNLESYSTDCRLLFECETPDAIARSHWGSYKLS